MITFTGAVSVYRKRLKATSAGETTLTIDDTIVSSEEAIVYRRISIENRTSNYTRLVIGVYSGGIFHQYEEHDTPQANDIMWVNDPIVVQANENLRIQLTGTTSGDEIYVYLEGDKGTPGVPVAEEPAPPEEPVPEVPEEEMTPEEKRRMEVKRHKLFWFPRGDLPRILDTAKRHWIINIAEGTIGSDMPEELEAMLIGMFEEPSDKVLKHIEHLKEIWKEPGDPRAYQSFIMPPAIETEIRTIFSLRGKSGGGET